jgi:hypothetical protein
MVAEKGAAVDDLIGRDTQHPEPRVADAVRDHDRPGEFYRVLNRHAARLEVRVSRVGVARLEHQTCQARRIAPQIRPARLSAGKKPQQLEIVCLKNREMVA